jgi:hypothetical protein
MTTQRHRLGMGPRTARRMGKRRTIGRRLLGWLANFYPDTVFYSRNFMSGLRLDLTSCHDFHAEPGNTAMLGTAIAVGRLMAPGDTLTATFTGATDAGAEIGDFRITIERLA